MITHNSKIDTYKAATQLKRRALKASRARGLTPAARDHLRLIAEHADGLRRSVYGWPDPPVGEWDPESAAETLARLDARLQQATTTTGQNH